MPFSHIVTENGDILMKSNTMRIIIINIILPLIIGIIIYILYSPDVIGVKWLSTYINLPIFYCSALNSNIVFKIIRNYVLDMLWAYSLSCTLILLTSNIFLSFVLSGGFAVLIEYCQYFGIFEGTFDYLDIACELIAIFITKLTTRRFLNEK